MGQYCKWSRAYKENSAKEAFGLTTPLITLASEQKMGKTEKEQYG